MCALGFVCVCVSVYLCVCVTYSSDGVLMKAISQHMRGESGGIGTQTCDNPKGVCVCVCVFVCV